MNEGKKIIKLLEEITKKIDRIDKRLSGSTKTKLLNVPLKIKSAKKSTTGSLLLQFKEEKFFDQPRTLNEIVKKFDAESRSIKPNGLTLPLQKLVRNRELSRILKNGRWAYVKR